MRNKWLDRIEQDSPECPKCGRLIEQYCPDCFEYSLRQLDELQRIIDAYEPCSLTAAPCHHEIHEINGRTVHVINTPVEWHSLKENDE